MMMSLNLMKLFSFTTHTGLHLQQKISFRQAHHVAVQSVREPSFLMRSSNCLFTLTFHC